jgi:3-oxoacyl-[acyl-carrier protein] reductase
MDLGITGRRAIVCGASAGLGRGVATALAREGVVLTLAARGGDRLDRAVKEIAAETGARVIAVACDVTTDEGRGTLLAAEPAPDILVNNAGGPPPGDFRQFSRDDWIKAIDGNMLSAVFMIRATLDGMIERGFGRVVNITSGSVKSPIAMLPLSNSARAGLTGFVGGVSRQVAKHNVTINNVLPGLFDTDRLKSLYADEAAKDRSRGAIPAGRFGDPAEFGDLVAFLCGAGAGYITGQNLLIDGGSFPGLL